jgi:polar amino acid transport system substrate-binding protein
MKRAMRIGTLLLVLAMMVGLLLSCGKSAEEQAAAAPAAEKSLVDQILERGTMKVGVGVFVPWSFKDKDGNLVGFEIDVATQLAKDMGVEVEFVPTQWSGIIPALLTGKFDAIISGMGITPERGLKVNFSMPYDYSGMSICANKKLAPNWYSLEDFNKPNVVLSVRMGGTPVDAAKKYMPKAQLRMFDDENQAYQEVLNGKAHACISSAPGPEVWVNKHPDVLYLPLKGDTFTKEPIGFAVRKGDFDSLTYFNNWIQYRSDTGWLQEKHYYWFVTDEWSGLLAE